MKWISWLWIIALGFFVIWLFMPLDESDYQSYILEEKARPNIDPNVYYWTYTPIHYYFSEDYPCEGSRKNNIEKSFNIIEEKTDNLVNFYEEESENAIEISCLKSDEEDVAGYGGIEFYEGEKEILKGFVEFTEINPTEYEECQYYPSTELHEILHAFGFDHIEGRRSILNSLPEYGEACTSLDSEIIDCLKHIYSKGQGNYTCQGVPFVY